MYLKKLNIPILCLCFSAIFLFYGLSSKPVGAEQGQQESHIHGVAHINVALEKNELYIEFRSPSANIVGFEHSPGNEKEEKAVKQAVEILNAGDKVFKLSSKVGAVIEEIVVITGHEDENHDESHTDDHSEKHDADHNNHAKEDHDKQHSEFKAIYRFNCKHPDKLKHLDVVLFEHFRGIEEIEVQILTETKQTALELTPKKNRITL